MGMFDRIPVLGDIFNDDEERYNRAMDRMKAAYERYRPKIEAYRMQGLQQRLGAFDQTINPELARLFGQDATINTGLLGQNPMRPPAQPVQLARPQEQLPPGSFVGDGYPGGPPQIPSARRARG